MRLYFRDCKKKERLLKSNIKDEEEAVRVIQEFLEKRGYDIPYWSVSMHSEKCFTSYDFGSHHEFFHLYWDGDNPHIKAGD